MTAPITTAPNTAAPTTTETAAPERGHGMLARLFSHDRLIWWLLLVAGVIRVAALVDKGVTYDGGFGDAIGYMASAKMLATTGRLTFYGSWPSAIVMPGFVALLAPAFLVTKVRFVQYLIVKIVMLVVSLASIFALYLLGRRVAGRRAGLISAALLTASFAHIYAGLLTLTENVFGLLLLVLTLLVIRLGDEPGWRRFFACLAVFCIALYVRQTALLSLPPALIYLAMRRYPIHILARQTLVAILVIICALSPWWFRNYVAFGEFVPFTTNGSYAFFEGTFQHFQPYDGRAFVAMDAVLKDAGSTEMEKDRALARAARARMAQRWKSDPIAVLTDYGLMKPAAAWLLPFYWDKVLGVSGYWVLRLNALGSLMGLILLVWYSFRSRAKAEFALLTMNVALITAGASWYLGLSRYVYPYMPFLYVGIAYFLDATIRRFAMIRSHPAT